ncbi:MAG: T9SS type A sorting domain-containing protein [Ignavibacteriae bacterium]|nr:T9SS type A sorting domain-containing protein [Ignavibacteriota bacterium]
MKNIIIFIIFIFCFCKSVMNSQELSAVLTNSKGEVFKTYNSGKNWTQVLPDNLTAVLTRSNGEKIITENTGKSWKLLRESTTDIGYPISLSPNPAYEKITIELPAISKNSEIIIVSLLGKIMCRLSTNNSSTMMLDVKHYPDGIYFVKIMQDNNLLGLNRFIKSR